MATKKSGGASKGGGRKGAGKKGASKKGAAASAASKKGGRKVSSRRELIDTGTDKRYVRRDALGRFHESDDVGRSLSQDRRRRATKKAPRGQGDRGD